jgi:uncharacterized protein (TIGR03435 family)
VRRIVWTCLALLSVGSAISSAQFPSFEAASIKRGDPDERRKGIGTRGNQLEVSNFPLKGIIAFAYDVEADQIVGGPKWLDTEPFTIAARANPATPLRAPDDADNILKRMLQSLLEERFKLAIHRETRIEAIYQLIVANAGPRLKESAGADANGRQGFFGRPGYWVATNQGIGPLLGTLSRQLGRPVKDRTGLAGKYDFTLTYASELAQGDGSAPSLFTALEEQLGLKLQSARGLVDVLVVDNAERPEPD